MTISTNISIIDRTIAATIIDLKLKHVLINKVTIYRNNEAIYIFSSLIAKFKNIFIDIEDTIDISKD